VKPWQAIILAASRGADDPMAKAYGTLHKCLIDVAGKPMLARVHDALAHSKHIGKIAVVVETADVIAMALGPVHGAHWIRPADSAPASALAAAQSMAHFPLLVTTGDHALLTTEMVDHVLDASAALGADFTVGLARAETILAAYPQTRRTFFKLGPDRVSGCNLFTIHSPLGFKILEHWRYLEQNRKKPWKLVAAFGLKPLLLLLTGQMTVERAFGFVSAKLGLSVRALILPFAEAAIDVDKPADKDLAEQILRARR
jgi:GTP:adenosylcobinamide-phosphate guanylyltransferase